MNSKKSKIGWLISGIILLILILGLIVFLVNKKDKNPEIAIGDYINYTTDVNKEYNSKALYSGNKKDETIKSEDLKWQVWDVNEETITLISSTPTEKLVSFTGATGYNNAVYLLNDICKNLYSNDSLKATARSLNMEDIDKVSKFKKDTYESYNKEYSPKDKNVPSILKEKYNRSEQDKLLNNDKNSSKDKNFKGNNSVYEFELGYIDSEHRNLVDANKSYWLATRALDINTKTSYFDLFMYNEKMITYDYLYSASNESISLLSSLRPIVTINKKDVTIGKKGDGSEKKPYSIENK